LLILLAGCTKSSQQELNTKIDVRHYARMEDIYLLDFTGNSGRLIHLAIGEVTVG